MADNFVVLNVPEDHFNTGNKYTGLRMEMYRNRGKFSPSHKDSWQNRAFAENQFEQYMRQMDAALYPDGKDKDLELSSYGMKKEDMIYIDGMSAYEHALKLGYKAEELKANPDIVRAEIAAAMTGGRNHVDIMVPTKDENGKVVLQSRELRADVRDLKGKERLTETSRSKRMDSLYKSKNRDKRMEAALNAAGEKWQEAVIKTGYEKNAKLLSEKMLINMGLTEEDVQNQSKFVHEKDAALKEAREIAAEAAKGNTARWDEINKTFVKKACEKTVMNYGSADDIANETMGLTEKQAADMWEQLGRKAGVGQQGRVDSRAHNAMMYKLYRNPDLKLEDIANNKEMFAEAILEYKDFLKENSLDSAERTPEQIEESIQKQADFYKFYRKTVADMVLNLPFDGTNYEDCVRNIEKMEHINQLMINCSQTEQDIRNVHKDAYMKAYGGEEAYKKSSDAGLMVQNILMNMYAPIMDDTGMAMKAGYVYAMEKFAPVFKRMNSDNIEEITAYWSAETAGAVGPSAMACFMGKNNTELHAYMHGGPLPGDRKQIDAMVNENIEFMATAGEKEKKDYKVRSIDDIMKELDRLDEIKGISKKAKGVEKANRTKSSLDDLIKDEDHIPETRKRSKPVYVKGSNKNQKMEMDPLKKK